MSSHVAKDPFIFSYLAVHDIRPRVITARQSAMQSLALLTVAIFEIILLCLNSLHVRSVFALPPTEREALHPGLAVFFSIPAAKRWSWGAHQRALVLLLYEALMWVICVVILDEERKRKKK